MLHFTNSQCTSIGGLSHWHEMPARKIFFKIKTQTVKPKRRDMVLIIYGNVNLARWLLNQMYSRCSNTSSHFTQQKQDQINSDTWRMASSGMLCHVALVRTDVSEELSACIIRVTRFGEQGITLAITSNWCMQHSISSQCALVVSYV
jgi:hypothetical protein